MEIGVEELFKMLLYLLGEIKKIKKIIVALWSFS